MSLDSEVKKFTEIALDQANKVVKQVTNDVMTSTVKKTPVDTGQLANNWFASINSPMFMGKRLPDQSAGDSLDGIDTVIKAYKKSDWGQSLWLTNSLDYANDIETGNKSGKAPQGMMRLSMMNAVAKFK